MALKLTRSPMTMLMIADDHDHYRNDDFLVIRLIMIMTTMMTFYSDNYDDSMVTSTMITMMTLIMGWLSTVPAQV